MMVPTHALVGAVLGFGVGLATGDPSLSYVWIGLIAGGLPDLDMLGRHRRDLHPPIIVTAALVPMAFVVAVWSTPTAIGVFTGLLAVSVHCWMDLLGGDLTLRPWERRGHRGVYAHALGRWLRPRRWIPYDGAPGDLAVSLIAAVVLFRVVEGPLVGIVVALTAIAVAYATVRKHIPSLGVVILDRLPGPIVARLPPALSLTDQ